jgi:hypothetical protein
MNFLRLIFTDIVLDIFYFPLWWYSRGLVLALKWALKEIGETQDFLGVHIWVANIFRPMYGQRDIQGKIISFFMRIVQIILRLTALLGLSTFYLLIFIVYLILPIVVFYGAIVHLPSLFK